MKHRALATWSRLSYLRNTYENFEPAVKFKTIQWTLDSNNVFHEHYMYVIFYNKHI